MPPSADAAQRPVVIAYDGSSEAKGAIAEAARELAAGRQAVVVTVREPLEHIAFVGLGTGTMLNPATLTTMDDSAEKEAVAVAEEGADLARAAGFSAQPRVEVARSPSQKIVAVADELDAGVIVLGSRGRTGLSKVLLGSVASAVAQHSSRSVLIVRSSA